MNVYILIGLPGSGKSTWASEKTEDDETGALIVCRDDLRTMFNPNYGVTKSIEPIVMKTAEYAIHQVLLKDKDLIIDETNITIKRRKSWINHVKAIWMATIATSLRVSDPIIHFIDFSDITDTLDRRMNESRGLTRQKWGSVIRGMKKSLQPVDSSEEYDVWIKIDKDGVKYIQDDRRKNRGENDNRNSLC